MVTIRFGCEHRSTQTSPAVLGMRYRVFVVTAAQYIGRPHQPSPRLVGPRYRRYIDLNEDCESATIAGRHCSQPRSLSEPSSEPQGGVSASG